MANQIVVWKEKKNNCPCLIIIPMKYVARSNMGSGYERNTRTRLIDYTDSDTARITMRESFLK